MVATPNLSARVRIYGRVQGVWFRAWTAREADQLGLDGWVRNRADGSVEAVFQGSRTAVAAMIERCRRGPPAARVDRIEQTAELEPVPTGFVQKSSC
jgi:acylphosphatase